jgi:hypothetical protein
MDGSDAAHALLSSFLSLDLLFSFLVVALCPTRRQHQRQPPKQHNPAMKKRHELALLVFTGFMTLYALRSILSVTVVHMQTEYNWSGTFKGAFRWLAITVVSWC